MRCKIMERVIEVTLANNIETKLSSARRLPAKAPRCFVTSRKRRAAWRADAELTFDVPSWLTWPTLNEVPHAYTRHGTGAMPSIKSSGVTTGFLSTLALQRHDEAPHILHTSTPTEYVCFLVLWCCPLSGAHTAAIRECVFCGLIKTSKQVFIHSYALRFGGIW
jgi:hypothetical protein